MTRRRAGASGSGSRTAFFLTQGIGFTVYGDDAGHRPHLPLRPRAADRARRRVGARSSAASSSGIRALNLFLADIYHGQQILEAGIVPADLVFGSRHFRREMIGFDVPGGIYAHVGGVDLIRDDDGRYLVLEDNLRTPVGRQLHAREPRGAEADLRRPLRPLRRAAGRRLPARAARDAPLRRAAGRRRASPSVVLLTPGAYNSAYFEHSFLARQMGIEIVEGRDLVVHRNRVFIRTTRGLAARRRHLPPHRRRLPRPARLPPGQPARRARPAQRLPRRQCDARQRHRHRRRRRQGDLPLSSRR